MKSTKRMMVALTLLVGAVALGAQQGPQPNVDPFGGGGNGGGRNGGGGNGEQRRGGQGGFLAGPQVEWKAGVSILQEYKVLKGVLTIAKDQSVTVKADGVEYAVLLPRQAATQLNVKSGDTVNFEGILTTVKGSGTVKPSFRVLKATVGGKVIDLQPQRGGGFGGDD